MSLILFQLRGDSDRLRQVLVNLLGNAIKFTPEGGHILLEVNLVELLQDHVIVLFSIKDSGIGIRSEKQRKIFEAFTQADASTTRRYGGTGLGLSISSELVILMEGEFSLESTGGIGSRFFFTVKLDPVDEPESETEQLPDRNAQVPLTILLVEGNQLNQKIARKLLHEGVRSFFLASDIQESREILEKEEVDIVLFDVQLIEQNGTVCTEDIRMMPGAESTLLFAVDGVGGPGLRARYVNMGFDDYLSKPLTWTALHNALEQVKMGSLPRS